MRYIAQKGRWGARCGTLRRKAMEGLIALTDAELAAVAGGEALNIFIFSNSFNNITDSMLIFNSDLVNSLNTNSFNSGSFNTGSYNSPWSYIKGLMGSMA